MKRKGNKKSAALVSTNIMTIDKKMKAEAEMLMAEEFVAITEHGEVLKWSGSQSDLMEMVYTVYISGLRRDDSGSLMTLTALTKSYFGMMHIKCPSNPHALASRARNRKGSRCSTMLERFCWKHYVKGSRQALIDMIMEG